MNTMQESRDIILDFTHTYSGEWLEKNPFLFCVDCSDIGGTDMYCTPEAEQELCRRLEAFPAQGIHFLDSGNYHYMTALFARKIKEPYYLVLFDNHSDMQPTLISELMSCGSWAKRLLEEDSCLEKLILIGPAQETLNEIQISCQEKLVCIGRENFEEIRNIYDIFGGMTKACGEAGAESLNEPQQSAPVYFSVDKDVLSREYACTNWDQGEMTLPFLKDIVRKISGYSKVLGVDICGEFPDAPAGEAADAQRINERTNEELYAFFRGILKAST